MGLHPRSARARRHVGSGGRGRALRAALAFAAWALIVALLPSSAWAEPSPTETPTVTVTATPTETPTVTVTATPTETPTVTVTATPSPVASIDPAAALAEPLSGVQLLYLTGFGLLVALGGMGVILLTGRG